MDEEKKTKREKEDQEDDDDDDSWRKQFQSFTAATATNKSNNKGNLRTNKQENDQETDEASSSTTAVDDYESVRDLDLEATPMSTWSSQCNPRNYPRGNDNVMSVLPFLTFQKHPSHLSQECHDVRQQATLALVLMASSVDRTCHYDLASHIASVAANSIWMASLTVTIQFAYRALLVEYEYMLQHDGLRPYLPSSLYQQLTQTTLHEFMTNPTFGLEYRHLLAYFLPLSPQQLQYYLHRLAPRHQQDLRRP